MRNRGGSEGYFRMLVCVFALAVVAASCGNDTDTGAEGDGPADTVADVGEPYDISVAFPTDIASLDPQLVQEVPGRLVYGNIFEPLIRMSPDGEERVPVLAASLPEPLDDTTWEVELRDDVTFASGKELTADDVVYTFERMFDPAYDSEQRDLLETIESVEAVDERTVRFTTDRPDPMFEARLTYALILPEGQGEVAGFPDDGLDGSGAYQLVSRTPGSSIVIEKRDDYWGDAEGAPRRMTYRVMPEMATQLAALQTGELDIAVSIAPDQVDQVPQAKNANTPQTALIRLNTLDGAFTDVRLREAVNLAIDREAIVENLYRGEAEVARCQIASPSTFGHSPGIEPVEHDPERAAQLVAEAYGGETLTLYGIRGRFAGLDEATEAVAQDLADVGFNVDLQFPESMDVLVEQFSPDRSAYVDMLLFQSSSEFFDAAQQLQWLSSDGIYSAVVDARIDELAAVVTATLDEDERQEAWDELNELACDQVYNVYLYYPAETYGLSDRIDWEPRSDALVVLTDVRQRE